jgi:hypothetical protein
MSTGSRLRLATDTSAGDWVVRGVGPFGSGVGALVPHGFEAYGRILHPALAAYDRPVSWATVAEWSGGTIHPRVQFEAMTRRRSGEPDRPAPFLVPPRWGNLPTRPLEALCEVLGRHTATADRCWFCLWEGYGWINGSATQMDSLWRRKTRSRRGWSLPSVHWRSRPRPSGSEGLAGPRLRLPERTYLLFEGPLEAAVDMGWRPSDDAFFPQSPNLFWPDDHAWCVATEIDHDSTYVAGSSALIADLLADDRLEALPVEVTDEVWAISDDVNV